MLWGRLDFQRIDQTSTKTGSYEYKFDSKVRVGENIPVIATSSTCTFTIRDEYPHLLDIDNADVREDVELATRYIYRLLSQKKTKLNFKTGQKIKGRLPHALPTWKNWDGLTILSSC